MDESNPNAFEAPEAEDYVRPLAAQDPMAARRGQAWALILWASWLMIVLVAVVWMVG